MVRYGSIAMHMADALISPAVGGALWAASAALMAYGARKVRQALRQNLVPMMGVLGAFVFAAQMINFSIPGTGSSGHLGGGLLLAILLGPHAAFLVIASVLTVQAFFFADGGLLALGCNVLNLGFFPAFVAYPLLYRPLAGERRIGPRAWVAAVVAAVVGLQLGALSVVLETQASGLSDLPLGAFVLLMQPIHLAIGVVEGLVTAAVVAFVVRARPEALPTTAGGEGVSLRRAWIGLAVAAVVVAGTLSWFASTHPDGLEWALARVTGRGELAAPQDGVHRRLARLQEKTAVLPDYGFRSSGGKEAGTEAGPPGETPAAEPEPWPAVSPGTSVAGLIGGLITLAVAVGIGFALKRGTARAA